jgi:hypothetical protein
MHPDPHVITLDDIAFRMGHHWITGQRARKASPGKCFFCKAGVPGHNHVTIQNLFGEYWGKPPMKCCGSCANALQQTLIQQGPEFPQAEWRNKIVKLQEKPNENYHAGDHRQSGAEDHDAYVEDEANGKKNQAAREREGDPAPEEIAAEAPDLF